jgi:hypothetical protein
LRRLTSDDGSHWYWFGLGVLAVWRVTHLLHVEHGPWGLFACIRTAALRLGLGDLFACFYCLSLWTAAPAAWWLASSWQGRLLAWLALSAGAILIEVRGIGAPPNSPPDQFVEEEKRNDMLR